jgi:asparagine synthase (glutamine-hydrolysing)
MCGIAGLVDSNNHDRIYRMVNSMHHRGPDDSGISVFNQAVLGMSRLAILDLSASGHQPMVSHCKRYAIVYNGECYNFKVIRSKLEALGEVFNSQSDTEVVLQAYVQWGEACLQLMNGMFAFAIWDIQEETLFAARDHIGIKPFYYTHQDGSFVFASEIQTLIQGGVSLETDPLAVLQYFNFGFIQQPLTISKNIKALLPGHSLTYRNKQLSIKKYWQISTAHKNISLEDAALELKDLLRQAVKLQMISDRPLGLFLSSGLDSTSVLAAMRTNGVSAKTFSIGFEENLYTRNEAQDAAQLASFFGSDHTEVILQASDVINLFPDYFRSLDQPSVDGLNTYLVSKYASQSMTVALSGLGGDELFAGYSRHSLLLWKSQHHGLQWLSRLVSMKLAAQMPQKLGEWLWKLRTYGESSDYLLNYTFARTLTFPSYQGLLKLNELDIILDYKRTFANLDLSMEADTMLDKILKLDMYTFMSSNLLRDMDPTSMAHSIEVRFPLLDKNLMEFAFTLPDHFKVNVPKKPRPRGEGSSSYDESGAKKVLLHSIKPYLPVDFNRKKKNGFKLPTNYWLKQMGTNKLKEFIFDQPDVWQDVIHKAKAVDLYQGFVRSPTADPAFWKLFSYVGTMSALRGKR